LDNPTAMAIIEKVRSHDEAHAAVDAPYDLLPRPIRWTLSKEKFKSLVLPPLEKKASGSKVEFEI